MAPDIAEFEESFVKPLSNSQAKAMLARGLSNVLVHPSPDKTHVRVLDLKA